MQFQIIDTTLREGLQFAKSKFNSEQVFQIAKLLNDFGVEYIETTNPLVSKEKFNELKTLVNMNLNSKLVAHIRCNKEDIACAAETGVKALNILLFGTSEQLQKSSHGRNFDKILEEGYEIISWCKKTYGNIEIRISPEDSFRTNTKNILKVLNTFSPLGIKRLGLADTSGIADPFMVYEKTKELKKHSDIDLECHFHNDTSSAVANAFAFIKAGGSHINTCVLGIGERNGITDLAGLIARMYVSDKESVQKYNLPLIIELNKYLASILQIDIPFNQSLNHINGFTHKAGVHTKAVLNNPDSYEIINPNDFGIERNIIYYSSITGWNAIRNRAIDLGIKSSDEKIKEITQIIKNICYEKEISLEEGDMILRQMLN